MNLGILKDSYLSDESAWIYEPHKISSMQKWKAIDYNVLNYNWGFANQTSGIKVLPN